MDQKPYGWWLPLNASAQGQSIDRLINVLHVFMVLLFAGWFIYFVYCLIKFRSRPGHKAIVSTGHFKFPIWLEVGIALFELCLLVFISTPIWFRFKKDFPDKKDSLVVRIVAEQYAWNVHYPGRDGKFGKTKLELVDGNNPLGLDREDPDAKDDVTTINVLHIPVDKPVIAYLSSKDVIHSFYLPVLRVKQDVIPGMVIPIWFQATSKGLNLKDELQIGCAQLCGLGHSVMVGQFYIDTAQEYESWLQSQERELSR